MSPRPYNPPAVLVPVEALRPALRRLVWCEVDGGSRWAREALGEFERADGALLEIVDEERKRCAMRGTRRGRLVQ